MRQSKQETTKREEGADRRRSWSTRALAAAAVVALSIAALPAAPIGDVGEGDDSVGEIRECQSRISNRFIYVVAETLRRAQRFGIREWFLWYTLPQGARQCEQKPKVGPLRAR